MLYVVMHPANLTPDFLDALYLSLKNVDDDPYLDFAYSIITGKDNTTAYNFFKRNAYGFSSSQLYISCPAETCVHEANYLLSLYPSAMHHFHPNATASNLQNNFFGEGSKHWLFLCSNKSTSSEVYMDGNSQLYANSSLRWFATDGGALEMANTVAFLPTSYSARIAGTSSNPSEIGANPAGSGVSSLLMSFTNEGSLYFGLHSSKPSGLNAIFTPVLNELFSGRESALGAVKLLKDYLILMEEMEGGVNTTLIDFLASNPVIAGRDISIDNEKTNAPYSYAMDKVQINATVPVSADIWWNTTVNVTFSSASPLVECSTSGCIFKPSPLTLWMINASTENSTYNITFVAAIPGRITPENSIINITDLWIESTPTTLKAFKLVTNTTSYTLSVADDVTRNRAMIGHDENSIIFALLTTPNQSLSTQTVKFTARYYTRGITMDVVSERCSDNRTEVRIKLFNPLSVSVENVTFNYTLPSYAVLRDVINASYALNGNVVNMRIPSLPPGETYITLIYESRISMINHTFSRPTKTYNRGETPGFNITLDYNGSASINLTLRAIDALNTNFWNYTDSVSFTNSIELNYTTTQLSANHPDGVNTIIIEIYDNSSGKILNNYTITFTSTSQLKLVSSNGTISLSKDAYTNASKKYFYFVADSVSITGSVRNYNNGNVSNASVTATIAEINVTNSTQTTSKGEYIVYLSWNTSYVGSATLRVCAVDDYNNSACYSLSISITRKLSNACPSFNVTPTAHNEYVFNDEDEIFLMVSAVDPDGNPVYGADVKIENPQINTQGSVTSTTTDEDGAAILKIIPWIDHGKVTLNISVTDPLNTSRKIYLQKNFTIIDIKRWSYNDNSKTIIYKQEPSPAIVDDYVTLYGNITLNYGNTSLITSRFISYVLMAEGSDVTEASDCTITDSPSGTDSTFAIKCKPRMKAEHCLKMNVSVSYDGVTIHEYNIPYCFDVSPNQSTTSTTTQQSTQ